MSDAWRDARLDGLRVLGLCIAGWIAAVAFLSASAPLDMAITASLAVVLAIGHLALPWHPLMWVAAEGGWAAAAVLAPFVFRGQPLPTVGGATALPLALFILMRAVRWPLLDRLRGRAAREERTPRLARLLRTESSALTVMAGLIAGMIVLPLLVALLFPD